MEQTNIIFKTTLDSFTNNFIEFAYLCVREKKNLVQNFRWLHNLWTCSNLHSNDAN